MIEDDPRAVVLWRQRVHRPVLEVWCDRNRHRVARLFALPGEGLRLCTPRFEIEDRHLFVEAADSDTIANQAAALWSIDGDDAIILRCNCTTLEIRKSDLREWAAGATELGTRVNATRTFQPR